MEYESQESRPENNEESSLSAQTTAMSGERKLAIALAVALVVAIGGMYAWKAVAVGSVEDELSQEVARQTEARAALIDQARRIDAQRGEAALRQFCIPFAWAIRREVMAGNLDQVNQYFTDLVRLPGFESAVLAAADGKVVAASDRKRLVETLSDRYPAAFLQATDATTERAANGTLLAVLPVMGLNQRLGTLVVEFTPPAYTLN